MAQPEPSQPALDDLVAAFRSATGHDGPVGCFAFDDSPEIQTMLGRLVLEGPKRATAGLHADQVIGPPPVEGQHDAVLDGDGNPLCIIRTEQVRTLPFRERDPAFAWDEGEDDRTLRAWSEVHERYFSRRAELLGLEFGEDSLVDFERFRVVWPELGPPSPVWDDGDIAVRAIRPDDREWVRGVTGDTISDEGWPTDRCPGVLARHHGRTAGVLVFVPGAERTEVVATALLLEVEGIEAALREALERLRADHGWGPVTD